MTTNAELREMLMDIENMKVEREKLRDEREKKKAWPSILTSITVLIAMVTLLSGIVMAFTVVRETASKALTTAEKAKEQSESNARDFAFFKGEVNAKLDNINKNVDRMARVLENMEVVANGSVKGKD